MNYRNKYARVYINKVSIVMLFTLLTLAACGNGDDATQAPELPSQQKAISFGGLLSASEEVSRAAIGLADVLTDKQFTAYSYKNTAYSDDSYTDYQMVMGNYTVGWTMNSAYTSTTNTNDWEYVGLGTNQTVKYWDFSAKAYRFFGYACGNGVSPAPVTVSHGDPADVPTATEVSLSAAIDASTAATIDAAPYFSRLWFSTGDPATYPDRQFGRAVQLEFLKPFARVRFIFKLTEDLGLGHETLHNVAFKPLDPEKSIATSGTVSFSYPLKGTATTETWATSATAGISSFDIDYYESPSTPYTPDDALPTTYPNTPQHWYDVLPARNQGPFSVSVQVLSNPPKTAVVPSEFMNWEPGYQYTYVFKISRAGDISIDIIQVAINDWTESGRTDHGLYNW